MLCLSGFEVYSRWVPLFLPGSNFGFSVANTYTEYIYCFDLVFTDSLRKPTLRQASNKKQRKGPVSTYEFK